MKEYYIKNMLSGLVTVIVSKNRHNAIKKGIEYFGVNQVRLCNR
jgi:glutamate/tyrosine decarboxylase-like PLP-dependent enzyme